MKILSVDTSTKFLTLAVYNEGRVCEYNLETGNRLSVLLVPHIKIVLKAAGMSLRDIDYFACGLGPGSFTGLRIGVSAVKGFSFALNKPVIGIPTLDALAMNVPSCAKYKNIITAVDAKREMVYFCAYKNKDNRCVKTAPYSLIARDKFLSRIKSPCVVIGDAAGIYRQEILKSAPHAEFLDKDSWYPKGHNMVFLALERIKGPKVAGRKRLEPIYLYPKECQVKRKGAL